MRKFRLIVAAGLAAMLGARAAFAQDTKALMDLLIKKGAITADEAQQLTAEARKATTSGVSTVISGKMFIDVSTIGAENAAGTKLSSSGTGVDVKRFYFGVTHTFDGVWSANLNMDAAYSTSTGAVTPFIKTAYLQAKFSPEAIVQVGSANQPWIPFDEDTYTYRYVENSFVDRLHFGNSADWGVHVLGSSGRVSYNLAVVNGGGYKNPTRSKGMDVEGRLTLELVKGLTVAVGGYDGKLGKDVEGSPAIRRASRYDALVGYSTPEFAIGAEYLSESDWGFNSSAQSDKGDGYSVFGKVKLGNQPCWIFGRWDTDKTSEKLHPTMKEDYFNVGVECVAIKGVNLAIVYKYDHIANPPSASTQAIYRELGAFTQIAF